MIESVKEWFNILWEDEEARDVKKIGKKEWGLLEKRWKKRRAMRHVSDPSPEGMSLIEKLREDPEWFKDHPTIIAISTEHLSKEGKRQLSLIKERYHAEAKESSPIDCYENWSELPPGHFIIDLFCESGDECEFTGLFETPSTPRIHKFRYSNKEKGELNLVFEIDSIEGMKITKTDKKLLETKGKQLLELFPAEAGGGYVELYQAKEILLR
jgi:hypothetical protein